MPVLSSWLLVATVGVESDDDGNDDDEEMGALKGSSVDDLLSSVGVAVLLVFAASDWSADSVDAVDSPPVCIFSPRPGGKPPGGQRGY